MSQDLIKSILPAAPITIADPTLEFNRINQENEALKFRLDEMEQQRKNDKALNEDMIKAMIEARVKEMMKKPEGNF
jgi:hypothetical protein